ncbi:MAG TPA: hypothetical protein VK923_05800 [Euzebyales bacterium]|nr:hypothetical protein [Euzebyales bacterium]
MRRNIFVLGLEEHNLATLEDLPDADRYAFHRLLTVAELQQGDEIPIEHLFDKALRQLEAFDATIDAIVGYWDFPISSMVPMLNDRVGLRSASLESVLKCEHKYWSRLEQSKVIDEHPRFALVDLDGEPERPDLDYPFWVKPVKSFSGELAFRVDDDHSFHDAVRTIRDGIDRVASPFEWVLDRADLPPEIAEVGGRACLAEESIDGHQVTIEGYSLDGAVETYGAIDSLCYPDSPSFLRFQYPSRLPAGVIERMNQVSGAVIRQVGLDASTFNVEFLWDAETDDLRLLEVNPRHSQSHAHLFADVDGAANHKVMVDLALGSRPRLPRREGPYEVAAKWFLRRFADGLVTRSPTPDEVAAVESEIPGVVVHLVAEEGDRLSQLYDQDSYSYKLANIYVGAADEEELAAKYERCVVALPFAFDEE